MRFKLIGALIGVAVILLGMGVAYGLPTSHVLASGDPKREKPDSDSSKESKESRHEGASKPRDNHGAAVSAAAHCLIKGPAHGVLVRSIATDKLAAPAAAASACKEAGGKHPSGPGHSDRAHNKAHGKSQESHGKASDGA